jgi:rRNA maturation protein Nop10
LGAENKTLLNLLRHQTIQIAATEAFVNISETTPLRWQGAQTFSQHPPRFDLQGFFLALRRKERTGYFHKVANINRRLEAVKIRFGHGVFFK